MTNPVDCVLVAYDDGAVIFEVAPGNRWCARDRRGAMVVRNAESLGEAARLYVAAKGLTPKGHRTLESEFGRLADTPEFAAGFDAYRAGWLALANPFTGCSEAADAWAAGWRAAAEYERAVIAAKLGRASR